MYILTFDRKKNAMICGHFETSKSDDECAKCLESGYRALYVITGTMKIVFFLCNLSCPVILLDHINRLY